MGWYSVFLVGYVSVRLLPTSDAFCNPMLLNQKKKLHRFQRTEIAPKQGLIAFTVNIQNNMANMAKMKSQSLF